MLLHERLAGVTPGASSISRKGMSRGSSVWFILVHCARLQHLSHGTFRSDPAVFVGWVVSEHSRAPHVF